MGSGVVPADAGTRLFRDLMGRLNTTISLRSTTALWTIAGRTLPLHDHRHDANRARWRRADHVSRAGQVRR